MPDKKKKAPATRKMTKMTEQFTRPARKFKEVAPLPKPKKRVPIKPKQGKTWTEKLY